MGGEHGEEADEDEGEDAGRERCNAGEGRRVCGMELQGEGGGGGEVALVASQHKSDKSSDTPGA